MKDQSSTEIKSAAADAVKVIAAAASEAAKVVASATAESVKNAAVVNSQDHDLLVEMRTRLDVLQKSFDKQADIDKGYALKEDLVFWRNLLVSGMLLSIFIGVFSNYIR